MAWGVLFEGHAWLEVCTAKGDVWLRGHMWLEGACISSPYG